MRRLVLLLLLVLAAQAAWRWRGELMRYVPSVVVGSPHLRYAAAIEQRGLDDTLIGRAWLDAAQTALRNAVEVTPRTDREGVIDEGSAVAWRFHARRGQRIALDAQFTAGEVFVDLFAAGCEAPCRPLASAPDRTPALIHEVEEDGWLVARLQPELLRAGPYRISLRADASLQFPVAGRSRAAVQSLFGVDRDSGRRTHEGVDIFAPRGTAVVAAADGLISGTTSNRLGGNVVWLWAAGRGLSLYYAHLDRHAVSPGDRVRAGDVLGYVGNTGNARSTAPHLHFGIYARPGGAIDPLPFICDAPCGTSTPAVKRPPRERRMHESDPHDVPPSPQLSRRSAAADALPGARSVLRAEQGAGPKSSTSASSRRTTSTSISIRRRRLRPDSPRGWRSVGTRGCPRCCDTS